MSIRAKQSNASADPELKYQLGELVTYNADALAMLGHIHMELLSHRRELIKPNLNKEYTSLCSPQTPITELLFGDDLQARMASIKAANKISQRTTSSAKFNTNLTPFPPSRHIATVFMAKQGQQLSPLPAEQIEILVGQEKDQPVNSMTTFPNISQVNTLTLATLVSYFHSKVACFKAGRLSLFYDKWHSLTSDAEVLNMISGQLLEFSHKPFQLYVPKDKSTENCWDSDQTQTCEIEIQNLLEKGAIVPCEHEKGEYISPIFTTPKKDGSSRMILNLKSLNQFIEYWHFKIESFSTIVNLTVLWLP